MNLQPGGDPSVGSRGAPDSETGGGGRRSLGDAVELLAAPDSPAFAEAAAPLLGDADRTRVSRYRREADRRRSVIGRGLLRVLAAAMLGVRPEAVRTGVAPGGAPLVGTTGRGDRLSASITHADGLVVAAASFEAGRLGVDVEPAARRVRFLGVARRYFPRSEAEALAALAGDALSGAFLRAWTLKEAWGKAAGVPVPAALSRISFAAPSATSSPTDIPETAPTVAPVPSGPTGRRGLPGGWSFWTGADAGGTHVIGVAAHFDAAGRPAIRDGRVGPAVGEGRARHEAGERSAGSGADATPRRGARLRVAVLSDFAGRPHDPDRSANPVPGSVVLAPVAAALPA